MELRSNQVEPTRIGIEFFKKPNADPSIIVAPTAFGKSIVIAKIAESVKDNLLILQPSKELLEQNFGKYVALGGNASIYSASFGSKRISPVTYATIGSIKDIGQLFFARGFTKMIIDECHQYPRNSDSMIGKFLSDAMITHTLGLTATPLKLQTNRDMSGNSFSKLVMLTSNSKKGRFFKHIIHVSQIQEMVELGYWTPLEYETYDLDEGKLVYNSSRAEYTEESIKAVYHENNTERKILTKLTEIPERKSILVFVPSVDDAKRLATITPDSVAVYGDMPAKERDAVIRGFKQGRIRIIYNVNVLSTGFDHPGLDAIICARSTASLAWFYQALGRLTRIAPGKKNGLIVDFSGNVSRFGKIEKLYYKKENIWKLYGEGGKLLTGCAIHEIGNHTEQTEVAAASGKKKRETECILAFGKYKGRHLQDVYAKNKGYFDWMYKNFQWNDHNMYLKRGIETLRRGELIDPSRVKIV